MVVGGLILLKQNVEISYPNALISRPRTRHPSMSNPDKKEKILKTSRHPVKRWQFGGLAGEQLSFSYFNRAGALSKVIFAQGS